MGYGRTITLSCTKYIRITKKEVPSQLTAPCTVEVMLYNYLTPCSAVLKNLTVDQLMKKSTAFYRTLNFIILFPKAHHWILF
jgi:hypothetical protein